jgi:hypothetical protein
MVYLSTAKTKPSCRRTRESSNAALRSCKGNLFGPIELCAATYGASWRFGLRVTALDVRLSR